MIEVKIDISNARRFYDFLECIAASNNGLMVIDEIALEIRIRYKLGVDKILVDVDANAYNETIEYLELLDSNFTSVVARILHADWNKFLSELRRGKEI